MAKKEPVPFLEDIKGLRKKAREDLAVLGDARSQIAALETNCKSEKSEVNAKLIEKMDKAGIKSFRLEDRGRFTKKLGTNRSLDKAKLQDELIKLGVNCDIFLAN